MEEIENQSAAEPPPPEFKPNEFYEVLLRMRRDQPRRYRKSISAHTQHVVELYEQQKARALKEAK